MEGNSNIGYFDGIADGRKIECTIKRLEDGEKVYTETEQLKKHVTEFYKTLFGR